ncbi:type II toxin-antitoxin system HipA family toxin YjjJ [Acidovorax sp. LjRoot66]|uniref:type II toxin-antitoxin system HipA family toxin YjjJ n=1 Tax=Acidovorax sp. LjRoot66 TaxID=3342334 RepID=UPI003ECEE6E1
MPTSTRRHADQIRDLLRSGLKTARELADNLGTSQPTVSRALQALGPDVLRLGASRSIQYALRDASRADLVAPIYGVTAEGRLQGLGTLVPVYPEGFVMAQADGAVQGHTDGLPWWLFDMRPQGYLGRAYNQWHGPALGLPERLADWNDSHVMRALLREGGDLPGNLLVGDAAQQAFVNAGVPVPIALAGKARAYAALALAAARGEQAGSSAGGEQPKFTAYAQCGGSGRGSAAAMAEPAHVIVKFSAAVQSPVSERWRDLLLAEHVALQVLRDHGIAAARTQVIDHGGQRFLEVERFDRVGALGRRALHSLTALDLEFVGHSGRWPEMVAALAREGVVQPEAVDAAGLLWAFGTLIGNTDMHSGNLSFMAEQGRPYQLAPAYDMTPMAFAPTAAGEVPVRPLALVIGPQVAPHTWRQALALAQDFVGRLAGLGRKGGAKGGFSEGFAACIDALSAHVAQAGERIGRLGA